MKGFGGIAANMERDRRRFPGRKPEGKPGGKPGGEKRPAEERNAMETVRRMILGLDPGCEQEEADRREMLRLLDTGEDLIHRGGSAHFTASSWIMDPSGTRMLAVWHRIYRSWSWTGGHLDGCADPMETAVREAKEETGILTAYPFEPKPFSLEILTVDGHEKRGTYVPSHLHLNLTFLLKAFPGERIRPKADENRDVKWFAPEEFLSACAEPWMTERIYRKLTDRFEAIRRRGAWK